MRLGALPVHVLNDDGGALIVELVGLLLARGLDPNAVDDEAFTTRTTLNNSS
jgi:hypothetical protein